MIVINNVLKLIENVETKNQYQSVGRYVRLFIEKYNLWNTYKYEILDNKLRKVGIDKFDFWSGEHNCTIIQFSKICN